MNQVWLEPGYNVCTGYKGALGGKGTFLGLWHPGTNRFSGDLPLSLGPELAFSASVQSSDTHQAGVALKSKGQQIHSVTTRQSWPKRGGGWEDVRALLFPEAGSWQQLSPLGGEACAGLRTEEFGRKAQNSWPFVLVSSKWETLKGGQHPAIRSQTLQDSCLSTGCLVMYSSNYGHWPHADTALGTQQYSLSG